MCFPPSAAEFKFDKLSGSAQRGSHFSIFYFIYLFISSPRSHISDYKRPIIAGVAGLSFKTASKTLYSISTRICLFACVKAHIETRLQAILFYSRGPQTRTSVYKHDLPRAQISAEALAPEPPLCFLLPGCALKPQTQHF